MVIIWLFIRFDVWLLKVRNRVMVNSRIGIRVSIRS